MSFPSHTSSFLSKTTTIPNLSFSFTCSIFFIILFFLVYLFFLIYFYLEDNSFTCCVCFCHTTQQCDSTTSIHISLSLEPPSLLWHISIISVHQNFLTILKFIRRKYEDVHNLPWFIFSLKILLPMFISKCV